MTKQGKKNQKERSAKVQAILNANYEEGQDRQNVVDILADLFHFCEKNGIDFWEAERSGLQHYQAERRGEP